jgi:hypothetical protein
MSAEAPAPGADASTGAPSEYSVTFAEGWEVLPSDIEQLHTWVRQRVQAATPEPTGLEESFIRATTAELRRALASKAEVIALFAEVLESEPEESGPLVDPTNDDSEAPVPAVLSATAALAFLHVSMIDGVRKFTPGFVRLGLRKDSAGRQLTLPREVGTGNGPAIETVELVEGAPPLGGDALRVTYYKPVGDGAWLGILTFQTPNLEVEAEWIEIFRIIADTLVVEPESENQS